MTHPTDDELDALVRLAGYHREHVLTGDLVLINPDGPAFAAAITTLRARVGQLEGMVMSGQGEQIRLAAELLQAKIEANDAKARADRAEAALAEWASVLSEAIPSDCKDWASEPTPNTARMLLKNMREREALAWEQVDAALAAQVEADARLIDALYRMALKDSDADLSSPWKSHKASAYGTALQAIRAQPHDRTALDRMLAEARAQALREAAHVAVNACLVPPDGGNPTEDERLVCEEAYRRIIAMFEGGK